MDDGFGSVVEACGFGLDVLAVMRMMEIHDGKAQSFIAQMLEYSCVVPTPYLLLTSSSSSSSSFKLNKEECCSEAIGRCEASIDPTRRMNSTKSSRSLSNRLEFVSHQGLDSMVSIRPCKLLRRSQGLPNSAKLSPAGGHRVLEDSRM